MDDYTDAEIEALMIECGFEEVEVPDTPEFEEL